MSEMSEDKPEEYVPISEFIKEHHYSDRNIRRLIHAGKLEAYKIHEKGKWLVKKDQKIEASKQAQKRKLATAEKYKEHEKDLASALQTLVNNLRLVKRYGSVDGVPIDEIVLREEDEKRIQQVDPVLSGWLLSHIQVELPELRSVKRWGHLRPEDITDELLHKLSLISYRGDFRGTCERCRDWS